MSPASQKELLAFAEHLGAYFEAGGHPRLAGRVFGWLLVCDPPEQTAENLAAVLGVSRSAISTTTKILVQHGLIIRSRVSGLRIDHFCVAEEAWLSFQRDSTRGIAVMRRLADRMLESLSDRDPSVNRRLVALRDVHTFLEREVPVLLDRLEQELARNGKRP